MAKKENFLKKAFKDMGESAKAQHEVDKAQFNAVKAESRANFEENRGTNTFKKAKADAKANWEDAKMTPSQRQAKIRAEQEELIAEALERKTVAEARTAAAKSVRKNK